MPARMRAVLSRSWRSIHCSTKNTKMALKTTCSDAVFETACAEATTPARIQTKEPKYQAGRRRRLRGRAPGQDQEHGGDQEAQVAEVEGLADAVVQQRQEDQADVDEPPRDDHEEVLLHLRPAPHATETAASPLCLRRT